MSDVPQPPLRRRRKHHHIAPDRPRSLWATLTSWFLPRPPPRPQSLLLNPREPARDGAALAALAFVITPPLRDARRDPTALSYQAKVVAPCLRAGLAVRSWYGAPDLTKRRSIFIEVSAPVARLLVEAERVQLALLLDAAQLADEDARVNAAAAVVAAATATTVDGGGGGGTSGGNGGDGGGFVARPSLGVAASHRWSAPTTHAPRQQAAEELQIPAAQPSTLACHCVSGSALDPYVRISAPYVAAVAAAHPRLYAPCAATHGLLNDAQALRMLLGVIEAPAADGGAGLDLDALVHAGVIARWFPAHAPVGMERLERAWRGAPWPWRPPLTALREYLGEKVALHFAFQAHLCRFLALPALLGTCAFVANLALSAPNSSFTPVYGVGVSVWSTFFVEFWKREQARLSQRWGMIGYARTEPQRPEWVAAATRCRSVVTGAPDLEVSEARAALRFGISTCVTATLLFAVTVLVGAVLFLRALLTAQRDEGVIGLTDGALVILTSIISTLPVFLANVGYGWVAEWLVHYENPPTASAAENALIYKLALFQLLNTFIALIYIAFIKTYVSVADERQSCSPNCLAELEFNLAVLIVAMIGFAVLQALALPVALRWLSGTWLWLRHRGSRAVAAAHAEWRAAVAASPLERLAEAPVYTTMRGYIALMLLFALATLFVVAFPFAPSLVFIAVVLSVALDRNLVLSLAVRPRPDGADTIGAWSAVFEALCYASTVSNLAVAVFADQEDSVFGVQWTLTSRLIFFVAAENAVILFKLAVSLYIRDVTPHTALQIQRAKYLVRKHIFGMRDAVHAHAALGGGDGGDGGGGGVHVSSLYRGAHDETAVVRPAHTFSALKSAAAAKAARAKLDTSSPPPTVSLPLPTLPLPPQLPQPPDASSAVLEWEP